MEREVDAVVRDAALGNVVGADALAALARADLAAAVGGDRGSLLLLRALEQPGLEHPKRLCPVLDLGALVLAGDDEPRRDVGEPHGGVGRVDALAARPRG